MVSKNADATDILVVVAHPDDESFGCGSTIAYAASRGARISVCCATFGEAGQLAEGVDLGGRKLAAVRAEELRQATHILGARCVEPLNLLDSGWDGPPPDGSLCGIPNGDLVDKIAVVIAEHRPSVVLTLAGDDGHRDHLRLAGATEAAFNRSAGVDASLYRWCLPNDLMQRWAEEMTALRPDTAHLALEIANLGTPRADCTTVLDTSPFLMQRREAVAAHHTQTSPYEGLSADLAVAFLTEDYLVRVAGGRAATDAGIRFFGP
ncbi:LmbE family N-acetylglucosaminyl deacetylase [Antricoccus suffuscus]|uniref:LmbE family N-acetylglucosaminyl deacetylase n=1 Tax=Antricoccus suffuscus TaxID=1629062 RepID=A0A2T1A007_9ACTN|nr:PIG-L deacetylase family protein [Antricoccus suffuscus]PRZ41935.1 LmbE family N-acetylglucosaminyl deacetylase [Antricoccus suffuscus]